MSVVSAIVLFAVIWFLTLFVVLPFGLETQDDTGETVEGTHLGAPSSAFSMKKKMRITTALAVVIWAAIASVVIWGGFTVRDLDWFHRMAPENEEN